MSTSIAERLVDALSDQISHLAPITILVPTSPIFQISRFVHHLTTTPVHPVYFPYLRFGAIHAARVTVVWAALTKSRNGKNVGRLQDLFGYLVMAWGGSTVVSLLLNQPPSWLVSPTPWIIYPTIYTLLVPTGLSSYIVSTCPAVLLNVVGSLVDGMTRGTTVTSLSSLLSSSAFAQDQGGVNVWTYALLSALAITSGGLFVGLFGMGEDEWKLGVPGLLKGGVLGTLDAWGAALVGLVWLALTRQAEILAPISNVLELALPHEFKTSSSSATEKDTSTGTVTPGAAPGAIDVAHSRALCVILLGSLLVTRAIITSWRNRKPAPRVAASKKTELSISDKGAKEIVVKSPVQSKARTTATEARVTPRKSPRARSKTPVA